MKNRSKPKLTKRRNEHFGKWRERSNRAINERFVEKSPVSVMALGMMERVLNPEIFNSGLSGLGLCASPIAK